MTVDPPGLGRTQYERFCALLGMAPIECSPLERAARLPAWLCPALVATPAACQKLRAWSKAPTATAPEPAQVLVELHAFGDPVIPHIVARTLCRLPPPVSDYARKRVTFLSVGLAYEGWAGPHVAADGRPWLVVLSRGDTVEQLERLIAHEVGHTWLLAEPKPGVPMMPAFRQGAILTTPLSRVPAAAMSVVLRERQALSRDERQVEALLRAWGFKSEIAPPLRRRDATGQVRTPGHSRFRAAAAQGGGSGPSGAPRLRGRRDELPDPSTPVGPSGRPRLAGEPGAGQPKTFGRPSGGRF